MMKFEHRITCDGVSDFVCYEPKCKTNGHNFASDAELHVHTQKYHTKPFESEFLVGGRKWGTINFVTPHLRQLKIGHSGDNEYDSE